jgi:hypothetical protein
MKNQINGMLIIAISALSTTREIHTIHSATNSKVKGILCGSALSDLEYNVINRTLSYFGYRLKTKTVDGQEVFTLKEIA